MFLANVELVLRHVKKFAAFSAGNRRSESRVNTPSEGADASVDILLSAAWTIRACHRYGASVAHGLTEVLPVHFDQTAHFVKSRTHPFSDAVPESVLPRRCSRSCKGFTNPGCIQVFYTCGRLVRKVRGDNRGEALIVTRVQD